MKTKYLFIAASLLALPAVAQETYQNAIIAGQDLNGTARYVGMGGAMEALGADISTMGSNPAGIALLRHSLVNVSGGLVMQSGAGSNATGDKSHASFDQAGFVVSTLKGSNSTFNIGFNYHKDKNFDYILAAANTLNNASQNKLTYEKLRNGILFPTKSDGSIDFDNPYETYTSIDHFYLNNLLYDQNDKTFYYDPANSFALNREHSGYIGAYDFNLSGSVGRQVYVGATFGLKDVHYRHNGLYTEDLGTQGGVALQDQTKITGTGFDIKAGIIVRPIENSPFRIGAYVQTPTWYDLTLNNDYYYCTQTTLSSRSGESYDFKIYTPWKFGFSLGHTVGNYLALGATYEYADYSTINTRINDGYEYDSWYGDYYETTAADHEMNNHTKATLKGVSTLKLGLEYKPVSTLALRLGYNYVSPEYKEDASRGVDVYSPGTYYTTHTDYTNWKSTNRFTVGLGYQISKFSVDLAYQYSAQKGDFYAFTPYYDNQDASENCIPTKTDVKNNRSQLLFTLGYHF